MRNRPPDRSPGACFSVDRPVGAWGQRGRTASACGPLGPWVTSNSTRGVVHEDVGTAAVLRNESETLLGVEPLNGALSHGVTTSFCLTKDVHTAYTSGCRRPLAGHAPTRR